MTDYIAEFSHTLSIILPIIGLLFYVIRFYIESRDKEVLKELRAFRAEYRTHTTEFKKLQEDVKQLQHERKKQKLN